MNGIVRQSSGAVTVESAPGQGTTFRVFLPRLERAARPSGRAGSPGAADRRPPGRDAVGLRPARRAVGALRRATAQRRHFSGIGGPPRMIVVSADGPPFLPATVRDAHVATHPRSGPACGRRVRLAALARPRLTRAALLTAVPVAWLLIVAVAWFTYDVTHTLPGRREVRSMGNMAQATVLYDVADRPVFTIFKEQRIEVPLAQMSPNLVNAVLSVEDQRFYKHRGVDVVRIMGAVLVNLQSGRFAQGGSTVTQQLARQSFLTLERSLSRKIKEAILAALIERTYSKQEILELYLNKVYFGDGFHGVEAAARGYFAKSASALTVEEAALIAGIIKSPSTWAPTVNLDKAVARRNIVLARCSRTGRSIAPPTIGPAARRCTSRTACSATSPSASTSRSRCGASWSTASAGAASPAAGCASTRRSIRRCSRPPSGRSRPGWRRSRSARATSTRRAPSSSPRSGAWSRTASGRPICRAAWSRWIRAPAKSA